MPAHDGFEYDSSDVRQNASHGSSGHLLMIADVTILFLSSSDGVKVQGQNDP